MANHRALVTCILTLTLTGCGSSPSPGIDVAEWSIKNSGKPRELVVIGRYTNATAGLYHGSLSTLDEFGCRTNQYIDFVEPRLKNEEFRLTHPVRSVGDIVEATLEVTFWNAGSDVTNHGEALFEASKVLGNVANVPTTPTVSCQVEDGNAKVQADNGASPADEAAIDRMSREEVVATAINTAGYLCARVTSMNSRQGRISVKCVENRDGRGIVSYRIDTSTMTVTPE